MTTLELQGVRQHIHQVGEAASQVRKTRDVVRHITQSFFGLVNLSFNLPNADRARVVEDTHRHITTLIDLLAKLDALDIMPPEMEQNLREASAAIEHSWNDLRERAELNVDPSVRTFHILGLLKHAVRTNDMVIEIERVARAARDEERRVFSERVEKAETLLLLVAFIGAGLGIAATSLNFHLTSRMRRTNLELQQRDQAMALQNERFDLALSHMSQGLVMFDGDRRLIVSNRRYKEIYDFSDELMKPGTSFEDIVKFRIRLGHYSGDSPEAYWADRSASVAKRHFYTRINEMKSGRVILISHHPTPNGGWVSTHEDITDRKRADEKIAHMARHDALTDLPNRTLFREKMEHALTRIDGRDQRMAVMFLDLDRFKAINDSLGHAIGDLLLQEVAKRLLDCGRERDTVARLGGDEFAILLPLLDDSLDAAIVARRIVEILGEPFDIDGQHIVTSTSIGIAIAPSDGTDPDRLLKNADLALYRAKSEGRGTYRFYEPEMNNQAQTRRAMEVDLRKALANQEFEIHYQPFVDLASGEINGAEALLRWHHPRRGAVGPVEFIPLAEEIGLIVSIGEWVVRQACQTASNWPSHCKLAVNVSPVQLRSSNFVQVVLNALASARLSPDRLELEITESVLLDQDERTRAALHQLRGLGVCISLDDFGTGYSSISYLRSFPFDKIKMDRSFVNDVNRPENIALVRTIAELGRNLGMVTMAEGVETKDHLDILRAEGFQQAQGYLFGRPGSADQFFELVSKSSRSQTSAA